MSLDITAALATLADPQQRERYLQQVRASRRERPIGVQEDALVCFALAPSWTRPLMTRLLFASQANEEEASQLIEQLLSTGWARSRFVPSSAWSPTSLEPGEDILWVDGDRRQALLEEIIQDKNRGRLYLISQLEKVGSQFLVAQGEGLRLPEITESWARFAAHASKPELLTSMVDAQLSVFIQQRQPADARQWLEGLRRLDVIQEGQLSLATSRAERQVELLYRRVDDERRLSNYVLREDQLHAFEQFLSGPDTQWGLHFMGAGGVGKTMLMRYLSAKLAPERKISTARVDFDHLDPSYPSRQPGLLLRQLGSELRLHAQTDGAPKLLSECDLLIHSIHEQLTQKLVSPEQLRSTANFRNLVSMFAEAMRHLPQPVVLLLDTCEELARLDVGLGGAKNIEEALALLALLAEAFYSEAQPGAKLRVVFSGRRPLASAGAGWKLAKPTQLLPRPFLRLHEVRGFSEEEARRFLVTHHIPEVLIEPILENSQVLSGAPEIQWEGESARTAHVPRILPYQLAYYARWIDKEDVDTQRIRETTFEQYLSLRIIERLRSSEAEQLLPAAALLGEFTHTTLRKLWTGDEASFLKGLAALSWQEWVENTESSRYVLQDGLRRELERYYASAKPEELQRIAALALEYLEPLTLNAPLDSPELRDGDFLVVLRLLTGQPQRLARWWAQVERRLGEENIEWLGRLTSRWLGNQQDARDAAQIRKEEALLQDSPIQAALLASSCAASIHREQGSQYILREWREVIRLAPGHPEAREGRRLLWRARAGEIVSMSELDVPVVREFWTLLGELPHPEIDEQLGASLVAAVESTLEYFEYTDPGRSPLPLLPLPVERLARSLASTSAPLQAFAWMLAGRARKRWGDPQGARWCFSEAITRCPLPLTPTRQRWLDWLAPENIGARVRVEAVYALHPSQLPPSAMLRFLGMDEAEIPAADSLDTDRLASTLVSLRFARESPEDMPFLTGLLEAAQLQSVLSSPLERHCHRDVLPLFTVIAEQVAYAGQPSIGWEALMRMSASAETKAILVGAVTTDASLVRVSIRMRLAEGLPFARRAMSYARAMHLRALVEPSFSHNQGPLGIPAAGLTMNQVHDTWRSISITSLEGEAAALDWARQVLPHSSGSTLFEDCSLALDRLEADLLQRRATGRPITPSQPFSNLSLEYAVTLQRPAEGLTLALRIVSLCNHSEHPEVFQLVNNNLLGQFAKKLGARRAAEIALQEGELLALRLPEQAVSMLNRAVGWFSRAADAVGSLQAVTVCQMAQARAGVLPQGSRHRLRRAYKACQEQLAVLPSWQLLEEDLQWPRFTRISRELVPRWLPWLIRIQACIAWLDGDQDSLEELPRAYVDVLGVDGAPAELAGWRKMPGPSSRGPMGGRLHLALPPSKQGTLPSGIWAAELSIIRMGRKSVAFEDLDLETRWTKLRPRIGASQYQKLRANALAPYARSAGAIPVHLIQQMVGLAANEERHPCVRLALDENAMPICWEGLLSYALRETGELQEPASEPVFFRCGIGELHGSTRPWTVPASLLSVLWSLSQEEMAARGLRPFVHARGISHRFTQIRDTPRKLPRELEALHLMGTPVLTGRGVRFQLTPGNYRQTSSVERGELLSAAELGSSMPRLSLCVLQDVPGVENVRTSSDRQRAAMMRLFAAELQQTGVPLVVCIPALAPGMAVHALERIASALLDRDVLQALSLELMELRLHLMSQSSRPESPEAENAFDFCLFYADIKTS